MAQQLGGLGQASAAPVEEEQAAPAAEPKQQAVDPIQLLAQKSSENRKALNDSISKLQESLNTRRSSLPFDPVKLRIAGELARPASTGNFVESLGNAMRGAAETSDKEEELHNKRLGQGIELLGKQQAINDQDLEQQAAMSFLQSKGRLGTPQTTAGPTANGPARMPSPSPVLTTAGSPVSKLMERLPPEPAPPDTPPAGQARNITMDDVMFYSSMAPAFGKKLADLYKTQEANLAVTTDGIYAKDSGTKIVGFVKPVETSFPLIGPQKTTADVAEKFGKLMDRAQQANLSPSEIQQLQIAFYAKNGLGNVEMNESGYTKPKRAEDIAFEQKTKEQTLETSELAKRKRTESNEKVYTKEIEQLHGQAQSAPEIKSSAQSVYQLAVAPNANQVFGLFSNAGMRDAILGVLADSGTSKGINLGAVYAAAQKLGQNVPTIAGESPQDYQKRVNKNIAMTQQAAGQLAILEVNFRKLIQGQGQVTNQESQMVARIGPVLTDRPEVVALKAKAVIAKATLLQEVDAIVQRELENNPLATLSSIRNNSQAYKNAYKDYDLYLQKIQRDVFKD